MKKNKKRKEKKKMKEKEKKEEKKEKKEKKDFFKFCPDDWEELEKMGATVLPKQKTPKAMPLELLY
ncbi:MAG: hypothetical protein ABIA02_03730 [Candidatus Falkowbacteria bacterium]